MNEAGGRAEHEAQLADLALFVLGALDPVQEPATRAHIAGCVLCRDVQPGLELAMLALSTVPPELFVDGPAPNATDLVRRTLDRLREQDVELSGVATSASSAAQLGYTLNGAAGWVRVAVAGTDLPPGIYRLFVVSRNGSREPAMSWVVDAAQRPAPTITGSAAVALADVVALELQDGAGRVVVRADL
ncbi:hypothetical protein ACPPVT_03215 [Angustibacter sp. McL0619]|uniref:hypothetical protein n=1 Tax=Angustibacter sp. McL0619 TaxID=3415676 RepID=UPI003CFA80C3